MPVRVLQIEGADDSNLVGICNPEAADWLLDWRSPRRNAILTLTELQQHLPAPLSPLARDFVDVATGIFLADITVPRGRNEQWVRDIELCLVVRELDFWQANAGLLIGLVQRLTGDNFTLAFLPRTDETEEPAVDEHPANFEPDCVSLLSGGVDSLAGAAMLLEARRRPHLILHYSGNPTVRQAQDSVVTMLRNNWPASHVTSVVYAAPDTSRDEALSFPEPECREDSRRVRSLLFMVLAAVSAATAGLEEIYLPENGILTAALPLTRARIGSFSTRSTDPGVIAQFNRLCEQAGWSCRVQNPFIYQTKAELIRDFLRPVLSPLDIQKAVSCWMTGRKHRQCGGCIPCLLRRLSMLAAGLPDEAYMMDILGDPLVHSGTDAFTNLVDLLSQVSVVLSRSDEELLMEYPRLLDLAMNGVAVEEVLGMLRRFAGEVKQVVTTDFPAAASLLEVV